MLEKTTFLQLTKVGKRNFILFGSGNIATKTIRRIGRGKVEFIADNSENLQNTQYDGYDVKNPAELREEHFIIICSTAIREISEQLEKLGFKANRDYCISPILNDLLAISELESLKSTFYFTSGSIPTDSPLKGGGLYKCQVDGLDVKLEKIYSGPCYGTVRVDDKIFFIDTDKGIHSIDSMEKVEHHGTLPQGSRAHGISFNQDTGNFYVTCSYLDAVLEINGKNYKVEREFKLTDKIDKTSEPMHHCNDNYAIGNSLYVSMFSSTGSWKRDRFDGCIAEFNIETGQRLSDIFSDLYMPHNVKVIDGSIHILDSLPGHIRFNNLSIQGTFPAFTRGLAQFHGHYYIGQSKNRNYSKVLGLSNNISIDCGVVVWNPEQKVSRFIQFPYSIGEIHSIDFLL